MQNSEFRQYVVRIDAANFDALSQHASQHHEVSAFCILNSALQAAQ
jgi:hypothetical protein